MHPGLWKSQLPLLLVAAWLVPAEPGMLSSLQLMMVLHWVILLLLLSSSGHIFLSIIFSPQVHVVLPICQVLLPVLYISWVIFVGSSGNLLFSLYS